MRHELLLAASWLILLTYHTITGWKPSFTDGVEWQRADSCSFRAGRVLPYLTATELQEGDKLLRIDYLPLCKQEAIPPSPFQGRLYLYEVERGQAIHLYFVESKAAFPWGWPRSTLAYQLTEGLILLGALIGLWLLLLNQRHLDLGQKLWHGAGVACLLLLWLFWAWQRQSSLLEGASWVIGLWGVWLIAGLPLRRRISTQAVPMGVVFPLSIYPLAEQIAAEALLTLGILYLPLRQAFLYAGVWLLWLVVREPALVGGLGGFLVLGELRLWQNLRILSPGEVLLPTLSIAAGAVGGGFFYLKDPLYALGVGGSAALLTWGGGQLVGRIVERSQYRFKLIQERLPLLWEIVDKAQLQRFILDTLREYAEVAAIHIQPETHPPVERKAWLRRSGVAPPLDLPPAWREADAIFSLPRYGWLMVREGKRPLRAGDIERLEPFMAGISIALRHLELFEAAHEARLAALRDQLSPHFLFNALNTLQALIHENPMLAEELMAKLGALLRRTLHHARHLQVPLEEEIALVRDYLEIEQQRFGKRLQVTWSLPSQLPAVEVPPFAIQLLAENVIKHAVSRLTRPVSVRIHIQDTQEGTEIVVEDDGPGIDLQRMEQGVGLSNLLLRLKELYKGRAQLLAERLSPGTRVRVLFPHPPHAHDAHTESLAADPFAHG